MAGASGQMDAKPQVFRATVVGKTVLAVAWLVTAMVAVHGAGVFFVAVASGHLWIICIEMAIVFLFLSLVNLSTRRVTVHGDEVVVKKLFTTLRLRRGEIRAWSILNLLPTLVHAVRGGNGDKRLYVMKGPGLRFFLLGWAIEDYERAVELMTTDVKELSWLVH